MPSAQIRCLDPLGHHATTCKCGGDVVFCHNKLRDILAETCRCSSGSWLQPHF